jgi:hypothetical protein
MIFKIEANKAVKKTGGMEISLLLKKNNCSAKLL